MKNKLIFRTFLLVGFFLFNGSHILWSQEEGFTNRHELSLNVGSSLDGSPEFSYHYLLDEESSFGVAIRIAMDKEKEYRFLISPNYRIFFGKKPAAGFFMEPNLAIFSQYTQEDIVIGMLPQDRESKVGYGLGIVAGFKFLTNRGWTAEFFGGLGRNFSNTDFIDEYYPRLGVSIGKRF